MNLPTPAWDGRVSGDRLRKVRNSAIALAIALFTLNLIDLTITNVNINNFGATEINKLFAPLIGTQWAGIAKLGVPALIIILAMHVKSTRPLNVIRAVVGIYMIVVIIGVGQAVWFIA
jgi:hypothetical protein